MFDVVITFIFFNIFILMLVFWILASIGEKFFKKKIHINFNEVYECGFLSSHNLKINFQPSFYIIGTLLILYDIEFILITPLCFNLFELTGISWIIFFLFINFIIFSFLIDWSYISLNWVG